MPHATENTATAHGRPYGVIAKIGFACRALMAAPNLWVVVAMTFPR